MTEQLKRSNSYFTSLIIGLRQARTGLRTIFNPNASGRLRRYVFDGHPVIVWAPKHIEPTTPVLVMHDGHNLFDPKTSTFGATWGLLDALRPGAVGGARIRGELKPLIIGVTYKNGDGTMRGYEYAPTDILKRMPEVVAQLPQEWNSSGPDGNQYHELIAMKILPTIAAEYGVQLDPNRTAMGGSSMGALTSLYGLAKYPEIYGTALAYSTHWPLGGKTMIDEYIEMLPEPGTHRIWDDGGTIELDATYWPHQEYFRKQLLKKGYLEGVDYIEASYPNTGHSEVWWAGRVEHPINWWLNPDEPKSTHDNPNVWVGKIYKRK